MEQFLAILIGAAVIWLLREAYQRWEKQRRPASPPIAPGVPATPAAPPAPAAPITIDHDATAGPVSTRLHELDAQFAPFANNSAHPRELLENAAFKEAVALLADSATPLETVMQYAQGLSWTLACAAFAALAQRDDRSQVVDRVMAQFDRLAPWPMYFALDYLMHVEPKPPVGAVVTGAKGWWRDSPIVPLLIQDYFTRRSADPPELGPGINASSASPPALIKGFLERVNHPIATASRAQLDRIERLSINRAFLTTFGRFWGDEKTADLLVEPDDWGAHLVTAEATLRQEPARGELQEGGLADEPLAADQQRTRRLLAQRCLRGREMLAPVVRLDQEVGGVLVPPEAAEGGEERAVDAALLDPFQLRAQRAGGRMIDALEEGLDDGR